MSASTAADSGATGALAGAWPLFVDSGHSCGVCFAATADAPASDGAPMDVRSGVEIICVVGGNAITARTVGDTRALVSALMARGLRSNCVALASWITAMP